MKVISVGRTSVHCEASWHEFYRSIQDGRRATADSVAFSSMFQAFVTFACIGRAQNHYVPLKKKQEIFIAPSLDQELHVPVLAALAYERLVEEDWDRNDALQEIMTCKGFVPVVEGWAQGGAEIFKRETERSPVSASEWLTNYVGAEAKKII